MHQNVTRLPTTMRMRPNAQPDRSGEFTFDNIGELCKFVGGEIRASRIKFGKLAEKANVCPQTVSRLAHGETASPRAATVLQILRALGFEMIVRG